MENPPDENQVANNPPAGDTEPVINLPAPSLPAVSQPEVDPYFTEETRKKLKNAAKLMQRDRFGHFVSVNKTATPATPATSSFAEASSSAEALENKSGGKEEPVKPVTALVKIEKTTDQNTLVNVHVNNPFKKIIDLLKEIKKQKAFSFTLKGSLGVAGIVLVLSTFGFFGGSKAFCSKGEQTHIGTIRIQYIAKTPTDPTLLERVSLIWKDFWGFESRTQGRNLTLLITKDQTVIRLKGDLPEFPNQMTQFQTFIATGDYDNCSQTLTISNPNAVSLY